MIWKKPTVQIVNDITKFLFYYLERTIEGLFTCTILFDENIKLVISITEFNKFSVKLNCEKSLWHPVILASNKKLNCVGCYLI